MVLDPLATSELGASQQSNEPPKNEKSCEITKKLTCKHPSHSPIFDSILQRTSFHIFWVYVYRKSSMASTHLFLISFYSETRSGHVAFGFGAKKSLPAATVRTARMVTTNMARSTKAVQGFQTKGKECLHSNFMQIWGGCVMMFYDSLYDELMLKSDAKLLVTKYDHAFCSILTFVTQHWTIWTTIVYA